MIWLPVLGTYTVSESSMGTFSAVSGSSGSKCNAFFRQSAANSWVAAGIAGVPGLHPPKKINQIITYRGIKQKKFYKIEKKKQLGTDLGLSFLSPGPSLSFLWIPLPSDPWMTSNLFSSFRSSSLFCINKEKINQTK